ncbi:MAG: tandem-95 repeat protein [Opitutaceae bacterium]|nr:tandem-95 repeat protein [Verrucomicrobiales bacterium]
MSVPAATYTVTTVADSVDAAPGTLRWAINSANTNANFDTIAFSPSLTGGTNAARITVVSALPFVIHPIMMDAVDGDPLKRKTPTVEITPAAAPLLADGLRLPNNCVVRGLAIFGFIRQMNLVGASTLVDSCNFGCDASGEPGPYVAGAIGVGVANSYNTVINCVVVGNGGDGIVLETASNCEILANFVGLAPGKFPIGNGGAGITVDISRTNFIGRAPFLGNIITANTKGGILVGTKFPDFSSRSTVIEGNLIGTTTGQLGPSDEFGDLPGNGSHGIIINQNRQITIRKNDIIGNHGHGIFVTGSSAINTVIEENTVGTTFADWPNYGDGIRIFLSGQNFITNNALVGNRGNGIQLDSSSANHVVGNQMEKNLHAGVYLIGPNNAFAQTAANVLVSNSIFANGGPGIVQMGNASQNRFFANNVFNNGGLGIDLGGSNELDVAVSPIYFSSFTNNFSGGDGPRYEYIVGSNYPYQFGVMLTNAVLSNSTVRANGYFITTATDPLISGGLYHLQFYASPAGDPSGYGEGSRTVGSFLVGPIPSFNASTNFSAVFTNDSLQIGEVLTATVTRTNNSSTANQTSEFSNVMPLAAPPLPPPATNRPPVAIGDFAVTLEDQAVEFSVKANDFDPDGDPITVESVSIDAPGFGFGPPIGTASLLPNQSVRFVPAKDLNRVTLPGPVKLAYVINDGRGLKANGAIAIQVSPVNDPPKAAPDLATTRFGVPVTTKVLTNDRDPDGDPLTVSGTTPAFNGTVAINGGKTITYTPSLGYSGTDFFTYNISDGAGGFDTAGVTVFVRNNSSTGTDIALAQSVNPLIAITNQPLTFRLAVTNTGPVDAASVLLLVNLSGHTSEPAMTSTQGSFTNESGIIRFELGNLAAGAGAVSTVVVTSSGPGAVTSSATIQSLTLDPFPQNDHVITSASIRDGNEPSLGIANLGDRIRLSWDAAAGTFKPEYRRGFDDLAPWRRITGSTVMQGDYVVLEVSKTSLIGEGLLVFRLVRQ